MRRAGWCLALACAGFFAAPALIPQDASAAGPASRATEMRTYLDEMAPLNSKMVKAEKRLSNAQLALLGGTGTEADAKAAARAFTRDLRAVYLGVKTVRYPDVLRGPHAGFVLTVKTEMDGHFSDARSRQMAKLREQWRQEVTAQLRYLGLVVPLWVKNLRWAF